jgi:hypothetical protein
MIGPHSETPKALLGIPQGLIDKLDFVAHEMIAFPSE